MNRNARQVSELETRLVHSKTPEEQLELLSELAWELRISQPERALELSRSASELAQTDEPHYAQGLATALVSQAFVGMYSGELSLAVSNCLRALALLHAHPKSPPVVKAWFTLGWANFFLGDYPAAMDHALKALQLARELGDRLHQAWALDALGSFHGITGDYSNGVSLFEESLRIFRELDEAQGEVRVLNNLAVTLRQNLQYEPALEAGYQSVELAQRYGLEMDVSNNCCTMVEILIELDRLEEAQEYLNQALAGYTSKPSVTHVYALEYQGHICALRKDIKRAESYLLEALELAKRLNQSAQQAQCHRSLSEVYEGQARFAEALEQHKQYHQLQETIAGENSARRLEVLKITFQVETAQHEAQIYRLQTQALEHQVEEQKRQQILLEYQSRMDSLTDLHNRRHFVEALEAEYSRHSRSGMELSLVMLDVDCFKAFNDTYGHVQGDECLRQVAQVLKASIRRSSDLVARFGGEEFVCILPETNQEGAVKVAETFRQEVMKLAIPNQNSTVANTLTVSLGVITTHCTQGQSATHLVTRADQQLYKAKAGGRNQIVSVVIDQAELV